MRLIDIAPTGSGFALALHGGAGGRPEGLSDEERVEFEAGLAAAYRSGREILAAGGSALDAVCRTVQALEDCPLFNAGRGAALTATGEAELDASVMVGDGRAGAVAVSRWVKNPVLAARKVMEETAHVLIVGPSVELAADRWGLDVVEPEYFVTEARQRQLHDVRAGELAPSRHGTVGAVALDRAGRLASATSTGGMVNQHEGRVGDTPLIGAGTWARDGVVAVSCTGEGEAFIQGVVAHEVGARIRYAHASLPDALARTVEDELDRRGAQGGLIAVGADARVGVVYNATSMFAAYEQDGRIVTLT